MRNKLIVSALLSAVSGLTLMQSPALANDVKINDELILEYCQYKLATPTRIEDPDCINSDTSGGAYSS